MKTKYSFVVLVIMCLLCAGLSVFISIQQADNNDKKFCDVINSFIATPAPKPADPKADPSREKSYEEYVKFVHLDEALGC